MTPRVKHPDWETILAYVEMGGDGAVADHCATCPRCARLAEATRGLLSTLKEARLPALPPGMLERALSSLMDSDAAVGAVSAARGSDAALRDWVLRLGRPLRELVAVLTADSATQNLALRGTAAAPARMLLFDAEGLRVVLQLAASEPGRLELKGQVALVSGGTLPVDARVLVAGEAAVAEYPLSAAGDFAIPALPAGVQEVAIVLADRLIRIALPS